VGHSEHLKHAPSWFYVMPSQYVRKPHSVSTRILVEDEQGTRYAKLAIASGTLSTLQHLLPMGVSIFMPIYLHFIKSVNYKQYAVYACYNDKLRRSLFYINDISGLGGLL